VTLAIRIVSSFIEIAYATKGHVVIARKLVLNYTDLFLFTVTILPQKILPSPYVMRSQLVGMVLS